MSGKDKDALAKSSVGSEKSRQIGPLEKSSINMQELSNLHVRRIVAANPNTPVSVLGRLAEDAASIIRRHVAENPRTPSEVLSRLANDVDLEVRLAVAENSNTPRETLALLVDHSDVDVRYGVAENPHMPQHILIALIADDNPYVRCRALKTLQMVLPEAQFQHTVSWQSSWDLDSFSNLVD